MTPLYGFLEGDTIGLLVLVSDDDTVATLARRVVESASVRVAPPPKTKVLFKGRELEPTMSVARAGITALDRVDVVGG